MRFRRTTFGSRDQRFHYNNNYFEAIPTTTNYATSTTATELLRRDCCYNNYYEVRLLRAPLRPSRLHALPCLRARLHRESPAARSTRSTRSSSLRFLGFRPLHPPRYLHFIYFPLSFIPLQTHSQNILSHTPAFQFPSNLLRFLPFVSQFICFSQFKKR